MKLRICIWMNIPSHHQSAFFSALSCRDDVDLQVRYLMMRLPDRSRQGWLLPQMHDYEMCVEDKPTPLEKLKTVPDWETRIHILAYSMCPELADIFRKKHVMWCHWSEEFGTVLAKRVRYNLALFHLVYPCYRILKAITLRHIKQASFCFAQGEKARNSFLDIGVEPARIRDLFYATTPLPNTPPSERITSFARDRKVFLSIARLDRNKGADIMLRAFASIKSHSDWCIVFCGEDQLSGSIQRLALKMGLGDSVLFTGMIPYPEIPAILSAADVFILASKFDGWGVVLNEAASLGKPLIASEGVGAAWHLIRQGENGFRFQNGSWKDLAKRMNFYMGNPNEIKLHGARSQSLFFQEFTPEKNAERLIKALEQKK